MNCKPGDWAMYVGPSLKYRGEVYTVLRPFEGMAVMLAGGGLAGPGWWVDHRGKEWHCLDSSLRPIRPGDISDEEVRELYSPKQPEHA
jgi:hypothetical protein